jgi:hypothetical protein
MNEHRLALPAVDGHVTLSPEDAQALDDATVALQRANIERLLDEKRLADDEEKARLYNPDGNHRTFAKLQRAARRATRQLRNEQDKALRAFAKSRGMRQLIVWGSSFNWGLFSLRDDDYSKQWCEICGTGCERDRDGHGHSFDHKNGLAIPGKRQLHAILAHTRHPFEKVAAFATAVRLDVEHIGWSWHGPEFTAVLFTRGRKS